MATEVSDQAQPEVEAQIADLLERGANAEAVTLGLRAYGPGVLGYLVSLVHDMDDAYDAFSVFSEQLWKSLDRFARTSSFRTWCYSIAWHVAKQSQKRHARDRVRPIHTSEISKVADEVRSATGLHQQTAVKDRFARVREQLDPEEQTLLVLRLDRNLSWKEVAEVLSDDETKVDETSLRKRYSRLKDRLRDALATDADD